MKKLFYGIVIPLLSYSCTMVMSEQPLPIKGNSLTKFPKEIQGKYVAINAKPDTLIITEKQVKFGKINNTLFLDYTLNSKNTVLKLFNDYYIFNAKDNDDNKFWGSIPFTLKDDTLSVYLLSFTDDEKEKLQTINKITSLHSDLQSNGTKVYFINPTNQELQTLFDNDFFKLFGRFKKL